MVSSNRQDLRRVPKSLGLPPRRAFPQYRVLDLMNPDDRTLELGKGAAITRSQSSLRVRGA